MNRFCFKEKKRTTICHILQTCVLFRLVSAVFVFHPHTTIIWIWKFDFTSYKAIKIVFGVRWGVPMKSNREKVVFPNKLSSYLFTLFSLYRQYCWCCCCWYYCFFPSNNSSFVPFPLTNFKWNWNKINWKSFVIFVWNYENWIPPPWALPCFIVSIAILQSFTFIFAWTQNIGHHQREHILMFFHHRLYSFHCRRMLRGLISKIALLQILLILYNLLELFGIFFISSNFQHNSNINNNSSNSSSSSSGCYKYPAPLSTLK